MDFQLSEIRHQLDDENEAVIPPEPFADGAQIGRPENRPDIIIRKWRAVALRNFRRLTSQDRDVKPDLDNACSEAEDVEIAIATRFKVKEHRDQKANKNQR